MELRRKRKNKNITMLFRQAIDMSDMDPQVEIRLLRKELADATEVIQQMTGEAATNNADCWASMLMQACGVNEQWTVSSDEGWKSSHAELRAKVKQTVEFMKAFTAQCVLENQRAPGAVQAVKNFLHAKETR